MPKMWIIFREILLCEENHNTPAICFQLFQWCLRTPQRFGAWGPGSYLVGLPLTLALLICLFSFL